jgi:glucose-1-phosphate cytidylyltransferase
MIKPELMRVGILAGGLGTRLSEETVVRPKPMVEIGARPIVWHIMKSYSVAGFREFVIALGYKGEVIKDYFSEYNRRASSMSVDLRTGTIDVHAAPPEDWMVHLLDTGHETQTGGRIKRMFEYGGGRAPLMVTYGDGVCSLDLRRLLAFHQSHGRLATVTAVRPPARFGGLQLDGDRVVRFEEKPQLGEGWINGGFFVLNAEVAKYIDGDQTVFEREPLEALAQEGELLAYRYDGFWQSMDTLRDKRLLQALWDEGKAPWKTW